VAQAHATAAAVAQAPPLPGATNATALLEGSVLGGMAAQMGQAWVESPGRAPPPHTSWADSPRRMSPRRGRGGPWASIAQQQAESPRRGLEAYLCAEDLSDASSSPLSAGRVAISKQLEGESSEDSNQGVPEPTYLSPHGHGGHAGGMGDFDHQDLLGPDSDLFVGGMGAMPGLSVSMPGAPSPMKPVQQQQQQQQKHHPLRSETTPSGNFSQFAYYMKDEEGLADMYDN